MTNELSNEQAANELKAMQEHIEPYMSIVGVDAYNMAIKALEQEPKTEHWVLISNKEMEQHLFGLFYANNTYMNYKCSGCGIIVHNTLQGGEENRTQYCPNCGAKMEGAE